MKRILLFVLVLLLLVAPKAAQAQFDFVTNAGAITITKYTGPGGAVTIPDTTNGYPVTSIGDYAFFLGGLAGNRSLTSVMIPGSVTNIGNSSFFDCSVLTNATIANGVVTIGKSAFQACYGLTTMTIPGSVTNIGDKAFLLCDGLTAINVNAANLFYSSEAGILFNRGKTTLIQFPAGKGGSYTIPGSVTVIGNDAFLLCSHLSSVLISGSATNIGDSAFSYCSGLTAVAIPGHVTRIGDSAFVGCSNLTAITVNLKNSFYSSKNGVVFNKSQTELIQYPCGLAGSYAIPGGVTNIGASAFNSCSSLAAITIPPTVASIGGSAFEQCSRLTSITIPGSVTRIGNAAFSECTRLTNATLAVGIRNIGTNAFEGCSSLASFTIPATVTNIGTGAFYFCSSLKALMVDSSNSFYASLNGVLFNKSQATLIEYPFGVGGSYVIPATVTSIGDYAFADCSGLTTVTIPGSVTNIGDSAFSGCYGLTSVTIPGAVTSIGNSAFSDCWALARVTILDGVTSIGVSAFSWCGLTSVTIPGSVTNIGNFAFDAGFGLTSVYFNGNAPTIDSTSFSGDDNATVYYLPGTTGWTNPIAGRPAVLWNPQFHVGDATFGVQNSQFEFNITGTTNIPVALEACTNLASPIWVPLRTMTLTNGLVYFSEPLQTNSAGRYYRLRSP